MSFSFRVTFAILVSGLFIVVCFAALPHSSAFTGVALLLVAYLILFAMAVGLHAGAPMKKLLKKADLGNGKFLIKKSDETGQLFHAFNKIIAQLEASNIENENIKKEAALKLEAETKALKEVIKALEQKVQNRTLQFQKVAEGAAYLQRDLKVKEAEVLELKNQLSLLEEKLKKRAKKNKTAKKK